MPPPFSVASLFTSNNFNSQRTVFELELRLSRADQLLGPREQEEADAHGKSGKEIETQKRERERKSVFFSSFLLSPRRRRQNLVDDRDQALAAAVRSPFLLHPAPPSHQVADRVYICELAERLLGGQHQPAGFDRSRRRGKDLRRRPGDALENENRIVEFFFIRALEKKRERRSPSPHNLQAL